MYPFNRHERLRKNLSAYVDGELSPREIASLESHLSGCDACRAELEDLRAGKAVLSALPSVEAPRSFALTPEMVAGPQPAPQRAPSPALNTGLRLAAGGLALALVVVAFADNADFRGADESATESQSQAGGDGGDGAYGFGATEEDAPEGENRSLDADTLTTEAPAATTSAGVGGVGGGTVPESTSDAAQQQVDSASPQASPGARNTEEAAAAPLPQDEDAGSDEAKSESDSAGDDAAPAEASDSDDGGADAYTVLEVVLAVALALVVGALVVIWIGQRRRAV